MSTFGMQVGQQGQHLASRARTAGDPMAPPSSNGLATSMQMLAQAVNENYDLTQKLRACLGIGNAKDTAARPSHGSDLSGAIRDRVDTLQEVNADISSVIDYLSQ